MGVQVPNVLSGQTTGTIITVDYTSDFVALTAQLTAINTNLTTLNTTMSSMLVALSTTIPTTLELTCGSIGALTPGTLSNSASLSKDVLTVIAESLLNIQENQNELTQSMGQMTFAMSGVASATQESVAVQQMALADQVSTNEFQKTATKDALTRNGLPEPQPRPITQVIQEKIQEATTINATSEVSAFVNDKLTSGVSYASNVAVNYVTESAVGTWFATRWADLKKYIFDAEKAAEKTYKQTVSSSMAAIRGGAKTPIPPLP